MTAYPNDPAPQAHAAGIRPAAVGDAAAIAGIYNHYIVNTTITFEEEPLAEEQMARRMEQVMQSYPWLVWEEGGEVKGYAYGHAYHERSAFRHTVECAIYLHHGATGGGMGTALYRRLLDELAARGHHVAIGAIALPNEPSVRLHEGLGFVKAGQLREVGFKFGQWIDVGYWQRFF